MTPQVLLQHFDRIGEAPDAIPRLRRFILDLAVRGKLVEQDHRDEPASELFQRIQVESGRQNTHGTVRKNKVNRQVDIEEMPFELPKSWVRTSLGEVSRYGLPEKVASNKEIAANTWVVDLEDIEKNSSRLLERVFSVSRPFRSSKTRFKKGDVLFGKLRPYLNKVLVADVDGVCTTEIVPIRGFSGMAPEYIRLALKSPLTMQRVDRLMYGMKMPRLGTEDALALNFPLPPLAEQHRIVAKVDELMALCDRLETAQTERESRRDRLVASSLHRLNNGADADVFREHARFYFNHLPRLTTSPDHIKHLRQTILNLAVRGKLVEQDPTDESTFDGLRRLQPNISNLEFSRENEEPSGLGVRYLLPEKWAWLKGHRIANFIDPQPSHRTPPEYPSGIPYIGYADILNAGSVDFLNARKVSQTILEEHRKRYTLQTGDFVIGKIGTIGKPFLLPSPFNYTLSANIILVQPNKHLVSPSYLMAFIDSPIAEAALGLHKTDSTHAVFGIKKARDLLIPVPPLAEQHRIVAKVDELMALCDQLETQLTTTQTETRHLLDSLLHEALTGELKLG